MHSRLRATPSLFTRLLFILTLVAQSLLPIATVRSKTAGKSELIAVPASPAAKEAAVKTVVDAKYGKLPLSFEVNRGQSKPGVKFLARGANAALALLANEAVLTLSRVEPQQQTVEKFTNQESGTRSEPARRSNATVRMKWLGSWWIARTRSQKHCCFALRWRVRNRWYCRPSRLSKTAPSRKR